MAMIMGRAYFTPASGKDDRLARHASSSSEVHPHGEAKQHDGDDPEGGVVHSGFL